MTSNDRLDNNNLFPIDTYMQNLRINTMTNKKVAKPEMIALADVMAILENEKKDIEKSALRSRKAQKDTVLRIKGEIMMMGKSKGQGWYR